MLRKTLTILSLLGLVLSVMGFGLVLLIAITGLQWNPHIGKDYLALWGSSTRVNVGYCDEIRRFPGETTEMTDAKLYGTNWLGFVFREYTQRSGSSICFRFYHIQCHVILAILLTSCIPAWQVISYSWRRRRKRKKLGLCVKCGYDLRGSKERCPECGTAFETP